MAHYVLFVPGEHGYNANDLLASLGLGDLADNIVGVAASNAHVAGQDGKLLRWDDSVRPERNASEGVDDKLWWWDFQKRYAIGWQEDAPTRPEDLQRNRRDTNDPMLTSFPVALQDGQVWFVPIARKLPRQWSQCPDTGQPTLSPKPPFAWYWDGITSMLARIQSGDIEPDNPPADCFDMAIRALSLNYRICREVVYALGLFDEADALKVIGAATEFSMEFTARLQWEVRAKNPIIDQKKNGVTPLDDRYLEHVAWKNGRNPGYAPALLDFMLEDCNG